MMIGCLLIGVPVIAISPLFVSIMTWIPVQRFPCCFRVIVYFAKQKATRIAGDEITLFSKKEAKKCEATGLRH